MKIIFHNLDIFKLAMPIALSLLIPQLNFFTNTAFIGRLGEEELGINGISGVFYLLLAMVGYGLSSGLQVLMARRVGEGKRKDVGRTLANGIILSLGFSIALTALSLWLAPFIFAANLHEDSHIVQSVDFMYARIWGLPFLMLSQLAHAFFIATGRSGVIIWGSLIATIVNILMDYAFIFGHWGFRPMGLHGAAVASVCSEIASALLLWAFFYAKSMHRKYNIKNLFAVESGLALNTLRVSSPLILQYFFSIGGWLLFFFYVEYLGSRELAVSQMLRSVLGIVGVCTWAYASACNTLVSKAIGQGLQNEVGRLIRKIAGLSLATTGIIAVLILTCPTCFLGLYTNDDALVVFSIPALRAVVLGTIIMSVATVVFNGVVGTGNTRINLFIEITCVGVYVIYCCVFIRQMRGPLYVAWLSECVYWLCLLLLSAAYLRSGRWRGKVI